MSHFLSAMHVAIKELHHLARIEAIVLAQIDEQSAVACLGSTLLALLAIASLRAVLAVASYRWLNNLWSVGIILEELSKLKRHYLLQDILLVEILKMTIDVVHERSDLVLVNVNLLNLVDSLAQLL